MDWMKDDGVFMPMLCDTGRNQFYQSALKQFAPGKTVCDVGAGTGFLSVMAANFGAQHVYAVEQDPERCEYLKNVIAKLDLQDRIEIIADDFLNTKISSDIYVSETINSQIFGENMIKLSNHALQFGGKFVPCGFRIWVEVYENHPIFILDLQDSEAFEFDPGIDVDANFKNLINQDFVNQYSLDQTIYRANCLNRLFTMLPNFTDIRLNCLAKTKPITVNLNQYVDEDNLKLQVPFDLLQDQDHAMLVVKWEVFADDIALSNDKFWFGNVAKSIRQQFRTKDEIVLSYDSSIRNWKLSY